MSKFIINPAVKSLFNKSKRKPIMKINFLGTGGAFHPHLGGSSMIMQFGPTILVDCGGGVFEKLLEQKLVKDIDYIFITHTHEDHISSLSTLIYYKKLLLEQTVKIECPVAIQSRLEKYLYEVCGHIPSDFELNSNEESTFYEDLNMIIYKVDTSGHHDARDPNFPCGGFVFHFKFEGEKMYIVYSGDINQSFIQYIRNHSSYSEIYKEICEKPENVFIFHEATSFEYPNQPHCLYTILEKDLEVFPNILTYHHNEDEAKKIVGDQYNTIVELEKEIEELDRDAAFNFVGDEDTEENRNAYKEKKAELVLEVSKMKKMSKLTSLTQMIEPNFYIEKDSTI